MDSAIAQPACGPEEIGTKGASVGRIGVSAPPFWLFLCAYGIKLLSSIFCGLPMRLFIHGPFTSEALASVVARRANTKLPETNG